MNFEIPVWKKQNLTVSEAAEYSGIGKSRLYRLADEDSCEFVLKVGTRKLIKRKRFDEFIRNAYSV